MKNFTARCPIRLMIVLIHEKIYRSYNFLKLEFYANKRQIFILKIKNLIMLNFL